MKLNPIMIANSMLNVAIVFYIVFAIPDDWLDENLKEIFTCEISRISLALITIADNCKP